MNDADAADPSRTRAPLDSLSVVIPVYNEDHWIQLAFDALLTAAERADLPLEVVIVDDGSTDRTPAVLELLADRNDVVVHRQPNSGRLAARAAGLARATRPWVLLLDSRVIVDPDSFVWLTHHLAEHPDRRVWCGHIEVDTTRNPYAAYWSGLVKIGWRRYAANPRLVSFGADDFDYYPKGTGCLLIPRGLLSDAISGFDSLYDVTHLASDDTRLLRDVAERERIWLSPDFSFRYHGKEGFRAFIRQSYFRGTTFVDGYLGQPGPIRRALLAAVASLPAIAVIAARRPARATAVVAAIIAAVPVTVRLVGGSQTEVRSAATLTPAFLPVFGAGVLRGLVLAALRRLRPGSGALRASSTPEAPTNRRAGSG